MRSNVGVADIVRIDDTTLGFSAASNVDAVGRRISAWVRDVSQFCTTDVQFSFFLREFREVVVLRTRQSPNTPPLGSPEGGRPRRNPPIWLRPRAAPRSRWFAVKVNTVTEYAYDGAKRRTLQKTYVGGTLDERLYALQDANWNVTALVDTSGTVLERYAYSAYGAPTILSAAWAVRGSSDYAWETLFAGYRWEEATELFHVRHRVYHPVLGGWVSRDPLGLKAGVNLCEYVYSMPNLKFAPRGLWVWPWDPNASWDPADTLDLWGGGIGALVDEIRRIFCLIANLGNIQAVQDFVTCGCFAFGILDVFPGLNLNVYVERIDCWCNILSTAQTLCNMGWGSGALYAITTYVDCRSLNWGIGVANWLGLNTGGGPGSVVAIAIGDLIVDVSMAASQNMITQGTPWPVEQVNACCRAAQMGGAGVAAAINAAFAALDDAIRKLGEATTIGPRPVPM